jgi:O-antigen/teichoic acid export membrane protein
MGSMDRKQISYPYSKAIAFQFSEPLLRNSFFMAFSSIFNAGCGLIFWMIAARLYTVEQVGIATALVSSLGLVILLSRLGFDSSIIRFFTIVDHGSAISTSLIVTTAACVFVGLVYLMLAEFLVPSMIFLREPGFAIVFLLIGIVNSVTNMTGIAFLANRKADYYFFQNLFMALRIPILIPFAFLGVFGIFGSIGLGFLVSSFLGLAKLNRSNIAIRPMLDLDFIRKSFSFSSWNYVSNILFAAPTLIIPIMVLNMLGETEAAKYFIASTIGNLVLIIPNSLGTSLFVEGSHGEKLKKSVLRAGAISFVLLVPAVMVLFFFGDRLLGMLSGKYVEALDILRIITLSSFPMTVYFLFVPIQNVRIKVKSIAKLNALRCFLLLGMSYMLMLQYGILGAGYACMITYVVILVGIGLVAWREDWI